MAAIAPPSPGSEIGHVADVVKPPQYTEAVQVHVWRNWKKLGGIPDANHPGHAAMQVYKNGAVQQLVSWWPDDDAGKKSPRQAGLASPRLSMDARAEMGPGTRYKLETGSISAREGQYVHRKSASLEDISSEFSRRQQRWMQLPEITVDLPGMGAPAYWGLHTPSIAEWWENFSKNQQYVMVSTTNNCSGAVALGLKAGGAECYLKAPHPWIVITPCHIAEWAQALCARLWELERKAKDLRRLVNNEPGVVWDAFYLASPLPQPDQWKRATFREHKPRSSALRAIDSALDEYMKTPCREFSVGKHTRMVELVEAIHAHAAGRPHSERRIWVLKLAMMALDHLFNENYRLSNSAR